MYMFHISTVSSSQSHGFCSHGIGIHRDFLLMLTTAATAALTAAVCAVLQDGCVAD